MSTADPIWVGMTAASAGRSTPGIMPNAARADTTVAPVCPALTSASASPAGHEIGGYANGRPRPAAQRERGGLVVGHGLFGVHHLERAHVPAGERAQHGRHASLGAHEQHAHVEMARGSQRPFDHDGRGMVTAHGIYSNTKHVPAADPAAWPEPARSGPCVRATLRRPARTCRSR